MGRVSDARERLIETAQKLIWERSYRDVGVHEICQRSGVKPGSFYYFFPSKCHLAIAALEAGWQQVQNEVLDSAFAMNYSPLDRITRLFQVLYESQSLRQLNQERVVGCLFGSWVGELGEEDEAIRAKINEIFSGICKYFESALEDAIALGLLDLEFENVAASAKALLAYYEGVMLLARAKNDAEIIRTLTANALKLIGARNFEMVMES